MLVRTLALRLLCATVTTMACVATPAAYGQGCNADLNGDGRVDGADLATVLSQWGNCPPVVTTVTPEQGSVLGGTVITITGTGFASTVAVAVGGAPCTAVTVLSPTQVRATTPPGTAGQAAIAVTTPAGTSLAPSPFNYVLQSVNSISPSSGSYSGGTSITISGQYLSGTTAVTIGGVPVTNLVVVNSTTVTAVTPPGSVGAVDVVVTGSKGTVSLAGGFTYQLIVVPSWATLLEATPDPTVVADPVLRAAIVATGFAWRVRDTGTGIEMLLVPPGAFQMGCSASAYDNCDSDEVPVHAVSLTSAFYLGRYEVTQAQWQARTGSNPSAFQSASAEVPATEVPNRPVERVSWDDASGFLVATGMRLPTEAEWEYACRAGTVTAFHGYGLQPAGFNLDEYVNQIAWFLYNPPVQTRPVGTKSSNGLGFHDMSGNVWEWVNDRWSSTYYAESPLQNPAGPTTGSHRVLRGGSVFNNTGSSRSSSRTSYLPCCIPGDNAFGFRVARNP